MKKLMAIGWLLLASPLLAQQAGAVDVKLSPLSLMLVDIDGKAVAGAHLGVSGLVGAAATELIAEQHSQTDWFYDGHVQSDAKGRARLEVERWQLNWFCIVARHEGRKISAILNVDPDAIREPLQLTLVPEREVVFKVGSEDLSDRRRELGIVGIKVLCHGKEAWEFGCSPSNVRLVLPPGDYEIEAKGQSTHPVRKATTVKDTPESQTIDRIDLPALRLVMLEGQPAPEITDVVAWKNSQPLTLACLRGKCVLLDFWGYWCGPCVHQMPELFALYDRYHAKGLTIIGIHCDLGIDEQEPVDTVAKLDERLDDIRSSIWGGRDIPFSVAIVIGKKTPFGGRIEGWTSCTTFASYGVRPVPKLVLINRQGQVVQMFDPTSNDSILLLEKVLRDD